MFWGLGIVLVFRALSGLCPPSEAAPRLPSGSLPSWTAEPSACLHPGPRQPEKLLGLTVRQPGRILGRSGPCVPAWENLAGKARLWRGKWGLGESSGAGCHLGNDAELPAMGASVRALCAGQNYARAVDSP